MAYKLKPLELSLDFEDRDYELGDTVDIVVDLEPRSDVEVRNGNIDLVCVQTYIRAPSPPTEISSASARMGSFPSVSVGGRGDKRVETFVHSNMRFMGQSRLHAGSRDQHRMQLKIQNTPPPHAADAEELHGDATSSWSFEWLLAVRVDVRRGLDPTVQRAVKVKLPQATVGERVGARPRMSTPKRSTGSSRGE